MLKVKDASMTIKCNIMQFVHIHMCKTAQMWIYPCVHKLMLKVTKDADIIHTYFLYSPLHHPVIKLLLLLSFCLKRLIGTQSYQMFTLLCKADLIHSIIKPGVCVCTVGVTSAVNSLSACSECWCFWRSRGAEECPMAGGGGGER